ncbi:MAG: hypothetical protein HFJ35_02580 [Clostridia bacterium]|nr:hypothetical protein [Clostridia bacterium]
MSEEEMLNKIKELEERNKFLESVINRGSSGNTSAYNTIRLMIIEKVKKEVEQPEGLEQWQNKDTRQRAERQIMRDLKWDLRVRNISDFRAEHIEPAKEYIKNYILPEELKKSRWVGV